MAVLPAQVSYNVCAGMAAVAVLPAQVSYDVCAGMAAVDEIKLLEREPQ